MESCFLKILQVGENLSNINPHALRMHLSIEFFFNSTGRLVGSWLFCIQ